jgi:biopolymer transport protein ExbD
MPKSSRGRRVKNEVNAGSMADIAFLLLIFFLVTTTIVEEEGILVKLPPIDILTDPVAVDQNNVFTVKVNEENQIFAENKIMDIARLKDAAKEFITNPNRLPNRPKSPKKALVSLQNDRGTEYKTYLMVYNELQAAYRELRETEAQKRYGMSFNALNAEKKKEIRNEIPLVISEAEPTEF